MKIILSMLIALTLIGCNVKKEYTCIGDAQTYLGYKPASPLAALETPYIEPLTVHTITVSDKYIDIKNRDFVKKEDFLPAGLPNSEWLEIRTAALIPGPDKVFEARTFHKDGKILNVHFVNPDTGFIYRFKGQCTPSK